MKGLLSWLKLLFSARSEASMRRFIAFFMVLPYTIGILSGIYIALTSQDFRFFITSIIAAGVPIMTAYFLLTWQNIIEITKNLDGFIKKDKPEPEPIVQPEQPQD
jgi:hypothetical protein